MALDSFVISTKNAYFIIDLCQIISIGLCDVETETLKQIHDGADKVKPSSITVRYASSYSFSPHGTYLNCSENVV